MPSLLCFGFLLAIAHSPSLSDFSTGTLNLTFLVKKYLPLHYFLTTLVETFVLLKWKKKKIILRIEREEDGRGGEGREERFGFCFRKGQGFINFRNHYIKEIRKMS